MGKTLADKHLRMQRQDAKIAGKNELQLFIYRQLDNKNLWNFLLAQNRPNWKTRLGFFALVRNRIED